MLSEVLDLQSLERGACQGCVHELCLSKIALGICQGSVVRPYLL